MEREETIRNAQLAQLSIMDKIHDLCQEHHLTYYLIGGTALGAIRHKGFIPWDVDIDIAMPRKDYELFVYNYSNELSPQIKCNCFKNTKNYLPPHATAVLENSKLVLLYDEFNGIDRKVYIDIMPLDNVPSNRLLRFYQEKSILFIKRLKKIKNAKCFPTNSKATIIMKKIVSLMFAPISLNCLNRWMDKVMCLSKKNTGYLCSMASHFSYKKQCFANEVYGEGKLMNFENKKYYVPDQIEFYLTRLYGDFMKYPPKNIQEQQMNFIKEVQLW